ncbi:Elongation factor Tu GTP binding domain-containing protein, partial [Brevibacterium sp. Mu109]|uniref:GTP-binding protein n=1 Tax=Brevibacterium sp. Mu109 TaxID=1255669 RepID=UPI000C36E403
MTCGQYSVKDIRHEASRRRAFAVISHPDAGKSTTTEALALHARAIGQAGATHGKAGRRATVSDWMQMEQDRGISISSAALQFEYRDAVVMLIDTAKGLESQTMKLFEVCAHRNIPIITVVNKWDRPGLDALALMDEVQQRTGLLPTPITWPVGQSGDFRGVLDRITGEYTK